MSPRACRQWRLALWLAVGVVSCIQAAPAAEPQVEVVLEGLSNPFALAVQPRTDRLLVANSGAGEVLLVDSAKKTSQPVVTGIPTVLGGPGGAYRIGPSGLGFDSPTSLVVAGPAAEGENPLQVFPLGKEPVAAAWKTSGESGLALHSQAWRVVTAGGDSLAASNQNAQGAIRRCPYRKGTEEFVSAAALGGGNGLWALTSTPRSELVAGVAGDLGEALDSRIYFIGGRSGKVLMSAAVDVRDVIDLAFSPKTGQLYAADFASATPEKGGIFRLDAARDGQVSAVRIATVEHPTALAFLGNGDLLFTQLVGPNDADGRSAGRLGRLSGGWEGVRPKR